MKFTQIFSAQRIIRQVLDWLQSSKSEAITERTSDLSEQGVIENKLNNMLIIGKDTDGALTDLFHVTVQTGVAYDIDGERILIDDESITFDSSNPSDTTDDGLGNPVNTPHSTGSFDIPLSTGSVNYLYLAYLQTTDETEFTLHKVTNAKQFYKRTDGYEIQTNTSGTNPDSARFIFLGQVNLTGGNTAIASNISIVTRDRFGVRLRRVKIETPNIGLTDRPSTYAVGSNKYYLDDHIKSVGNGTISPTNPHGTSSTDIGISSDQLVAFHRIHEHANGLLAGTNLDLNPTSSAMYCQRVTVSLGDDYIVVKALTPGELALVNGLVFDVSDFSTDVTITFTAASTGTYNIYFDSVTGLVAKTTSNISTDVTKLPLCTVDWDSSGDLAVPLERRQFGTINKLQRWVTDARPPVPEGGHFGFNMSDLKLEYYNGTTWVQLG